MTTASPRPKSRRERILEGQLGRQLKRKKKLQAELERALEQGRAAGRAEVLEVLRERIEWADKLPAVPRHLVGGELRALASQIERLSESEVLRG